MRQENNLRLGMTWEWHENGNAKANANGNENGNGMEETNINANTNVNRDALKSNGKWNWSFLLRCSRSPSSPTSPSSPSLPPASSSSPAAYCVCWDGSASINVRLLPMLCHCWVQNFYMGARPTCSCCQWNTVQCVHLWQPPWYRNAAQPGLAP